MSLGAFAATTWAAAASAVESGCFRVVGTTCPTRSPATAAPSSTSSGQPAMSSGSLLTPAGSSPPKSS